MTIYLVYNVLVMPGITLDNWSTYILEQVLISHQLISIDFQAIRKVFYVTVEDISYFSKQG